MENLIPGQAPAIYQSEMWSQVTITPEIVSDPAIEGLLGEIRRLYVNGGVEFAAFHLSDHPTLQHPALLQPDPLFFEDFLKQPVVQNELAELYQETIQTPLELTFVNPYQLESDLAYLLYTGGAYRDLRYIPEKPKNVAAAFCNALFGERFSKVYFYQTWKPWSSWFFDIAWDHTFFGFDRHLNRAWVLCATDTD
jgi:hypothetical protein